MVAGETLLRNDEAVRPGLYPPRTRAGLDPTKREEFLERLSALRRAYLAQAPSARASSLQIIDLDQIRRRFGTRWAQVREKALGIVESGLQREMGRDDAYVAVTETLFYLFRVGVARQDADRRARLLAADMTERLCGAIPGGVAVRLKTAPFDFAHGLAGIASFEQLRTRIEAFSRTLDDRELRLFLDNVDRAQPWFRPTIHLRKGLVSAYHLTPMLAPAPGGEPGGGPGGEAAAKLRPLASLCPESLNGVFDAETDNWSIQQAASLLPGRGGGRGTGGRAAMLLVPVRYETLAAMRFREPFLTLCRQLPRSSGRRLLFELLDLPPGLPQSRVRELMAYLKPFCLGMVARLPHDVIYAEHLVSSGIVGLSADLGGLDPEASATRETLHMLAEAARAQRMRSLLVAASSVRLCHHALRAGIDQLNGDAFMPMTAQAGRSILAGRPARPRPAAPA
jgi:hypothetical protein